MHTVLRINIEGKQLLIVDEPHIAGLKNSKGYKYMVRLP